MTVLAIVKRAATKLGIDVPTAVYGQTDRELLELQDLANDMGEEIARAHDWGALSTLKTETGDDSTEAFALPTDFDRLPKGAEIWSSRFQGPLSEIMSQSAWREIEVRDYGYVHGIWRKFGGNINIKPAPASTETISYYYQSSHYAMDTNGTTTQAAFDADTDTFRLPDRLLRLALIYRWKQEKRLDYGEEMDDYQSALEGEIIADKGSQVIVVGRARRRRGVETAYPVALS